MMAIAIFFALMTLASLMRNTVSDTINRRLWLLKIIALILLVCLTSMTGLSSVKIYYYICIAVSPIAVVWLLVCAIDLSYKAAEYMAGKYFDQGSKIVGVIMIVLTGVSFGGLIWLLRKILGEATDRGFAYAYIAILVVSLTTTLLKFYHKSNIMTFSIISLITASLMMLSVESQENTPEHTGAKFSQVLFFTGLSLAGVLFISLIDEANEDCEEENSGPNNRSWEAAPTADTTLPEPNEVTVPGTTDSKEASLALFRKQTLMFHAFMISMSCLVTVLVTSWKIDDNAGFDGLLSVKSRTGSLVQLTCAFIGQAMYLWTTIAPRIFPNRVFD